MTDRVRVAVAGLGAVAQSVHLPLLARRWDLFDVAALCDLSQSLRDDLGDQYGVPPAHRYAAVDEMVTSADVDGVLLLTSGSHGAAALHAVRNDVAVFCEKPLAYTVSEADRLADAEAERGRPSVLVAYMKEYDGAVARLRERLAGVGEVRAVEVRVLHPSSASQLAFANLRPTPVDVPSPVAEKVRSAEDELLDAVLGPKAPPRFRLLYWFVVLGSLVHDTSLLRDLFGGLTEIDDARAWPDDALPPSVEVSGTLPGGARARLAWHYLENYPAYHETLSMHHATGSMQVTFGTPYVLNAPTELTVVEAAPGGDLRTTYRSRGESFEHELVAFHAMVTDGVRPRAGVAEGRADIVTSQRIMRRLADHEGVSLDGEAAGA
ncbi:MAG TPA: Gfo/Idh/MocA family oxidoreductase [Jiangellaceae bacterium]|nr:Gfo/Idh/MocA family oxidoreductase [Jiangellaceae bacterium]